MKQKIVLSILLIFLASCIAGSGQKRSRLSNSLSSTDLQEALNKLIDSCDAIKTAKATTDQTTADTQHTYCLTYLQGMTESDVVTLAAKTDSEVTTALQTQIDATVTANLIIRPTGQVFINRDFCSCFEGKRDSTNDCVNFCASNVTTEPKLFLTVSVGDQISQNDALRNLKGWCSVEIHDGRTNPGCVLSYTDGGSDTGQIGITPAGNSVEININELTKGKTYVLRIIEASSGSNASSDAIQIRRLKDDEVESTVGPLKISPIHHYICITRAGSVDQGNYVYEMAIKQHFFYPDHRNPPTLASGVNNYLYCHDIEQYGSTDKPTIPRLELQEQYLHMWSELDSRFVDLDGNEQPDINDTIKARLASEYNQTTTGDLVIFSKINWANAPISEGDSTTYPILGLIMRANTKDGKTFCPTQSDYNGSEPLFKILKDYVGVDTEAIYLGQQEPESVLVNGVLENAPLGWPLLIRESMLKQIWFYLDNGTPTKPNSITSTTKTIMFFWPPDYNYPLTQKSYQKIFTVKHPDELNDSNLSTLSTTLKPEDRRFGCIPAYSGPIVD